MTGPTHIRYKSPEITLRLPAILASIVRIITIQPNARTPLSRSIPICLPRIIREMWVNAYLDFTALGLLANVGTFKDFVGAKTDYALVKLLRLR